MRFGVVASVLLHLCAIGLAFVSLPSTWRPRIETEPYVPIEIIAEAELDLKTSVPAMTKEPKPEIKKPEPPKPEEKVEPPKPKPIEEKKPEPKKPEPEPEPLPKPELKKPEPPKEKPKPKPEPKKEPAELDLDRLSALVNKEKQKEAPPEDPLEGAIVGERDQKQVGAGDRLTASDISKMKAAVSRCWQTQALIGAPEPEKLLVQVQFELNLDGTLRGQPRVANALQIGLSGNQFWKVAEQVAVRAVVACAPYDFLTPERYDTWREMQLNFDPREMAGF
jgi:hypothetical protein